jgi:hypothetical protein
MLAPQLPLAEQLLLPQLGVEAQLHPQVVTFPPGPQYAADALSWKKAKGAAMAPPTARLARIAR